MADNTVLNPGSGGDTYGADDIGGVKFQRVKLIHGPDGTNSGDVEILNPLPVKALGVIVTRKTSIIRPSDTTAYAVADAWADSTSAPTSGGFTISNAARASGGSGTILDMVVSSSANPATRLSGELFLFDQAVTAINDNAAFVMSAADVKNLIGVYPFSLFTIGARTVAHVLQNVAFTCVGTANLRFLVRLRNAYTPISAEELQFAVKILQVD